MEIMSFRHYDIGLVSSIAITNKKPYLYNHGLIVIAE